jgi:hypothetical protein
MTSVTINPEHVADFDRSLRCPRAGCRSTVTRDELGLVNGHRRIRATCTSLDCDFEQLVGIGPAGRVVELASLDARPPAPQAARMTQQCPAPGCDLPVRKYGMCDRHGTRWHFAGKPDRDRFIAAGCPTPGEWRKLERSGDDQAAPQQTPPAARAPDRGKARPPAPPSPADTDAQVEPSRPLARGRPDEAQERECGPECGKDRPRTPPPPQSTPDQHAPGTTAPALRLLTDAAHAVRFELSTSARVIVVTRLGRYMTVTDDQGLVLAQEAIDALTPCGSAGGDLQPAPAEPPHPPHD